MASSFSRKLIDWYNHSHRKFPWRETADPWRILVSELMLQQTRASVVVPYYERFLAKFPDASALATADEQELLTLWSGLGYYSRARNLQKAAKQVMADGSFPSDYAGIRNLAGVGDYTAAAVASISLGLPHAVLDGNVIRVTARLTNDAGDIGSAKTRQRLQAVADAFLDRARPGPFNQAMMELGATICLPKNAQCLLCPVHEFCEGRKAGRARELPVKLKRTSSIIEEKIVFLVDKNRSILLRQRPATSTRLAGFWELPEPSHFQRKLVGVEVGTFRHGIVNHSYRISVQRVALRSIPEGFIWVSEESLHSLPLSTITRKALKLAKNC